MAQLINVIIETPRHSIGKYIFDEEDKSFRLKKILPLGMSFPYDFGIIENTRAEDGAPADAMVISECNTYPGIRLPCRLIGALLSTQSSQGKKPFRNDRYFFIPEYSVVYGHIKEMHHFSRKHNEQLRDFFIIYNKGENKIFRPLKWINASQALKLLGKLLP